MRLLQFLFLIGNIALLPSASYSCDKHSSKFMEYKSINKGDESGITEEEFNEAIDKVINTYRPIVKRMGNTLVVKKDWNNLKDSSFTDRKGKDNKQWLVSIHGTSARYKNSSKDAVSYVVCHELGHHFGGAPLKNNHEWAVSEGQADYWAFNKCLKQIFKQDNNIEFVEDLNITNKMRRKCKAHTVTEDRAICQRMMVAIEQTYFIQNYGAKLFENDTNEVERTLKEHPEAQCRVDTLVAGALCGMDPYFKNDNLSELNGNCTPFNGPSLGIRPRCWFKPAPYRPTEESFTDKGMVEHIEKDHYDLLKYMIRTEKLDINRLFEKERNALMIAMNASSDKAIQLFLSQKEIEINHTDDTGNTALHYASYHRMDDELNKILSFPEVDINIQSKTGATPLMVSSFRAYPWMVKALVDRNEIDLTAKDQRGWTALDYAKKTDIRSDEKIEIINSKLP